VDRNANKIEIKKEVEKAYNVTVDSVKTMVCIGKKKSSWYKIRTNNWEN
jgi:large subunit ribosomal protein L23